MTDYVVLWSGSLERQGLCPSLSRYSGNSSLHHTPPGDTFARDGEITALQKAIGVHGRKTARTRTQAQRERRAKEAAAKPQFIRTGPRTWVKKEKNGTPTTAQSDETRDSSSGR